MPMLDYVFVRRDDLSVCADAGGLIRIYGCLSPVAPVAGCGTKEGG